MASPAGTSFYQAFGEDEQTPLRRSSSRILRTASLTFTGGATVVPPALESFTEARSEEQTLRRMSRSSVQQRMFEELWYRYQIQISACIGLLVAFCFMMIILFLRAMLAVVLYRHERCDQPLRFYLATSFSVGQITPQIVKRLQRMSWAQGPRVSARISFAGSFPGWAVLVWGIHMMCACKTCPETNPGLYYPTKSFIYAQVLLFALTSVFFSVGYRTVLTYWSTVADRMRPGCDAAVRELPKVPQDSSKLIDAEDGEVMECPICCEAFSGDSAIVSTPCSHYFHEDCLARWCTNHIDCPMCRAPVGKANQRSVEAC